MLGRLPVGRPGESRLGGRAQVGKGSLRVAARDEVLRELRGDLPRSGTVRTLEPCPDPGVEARPPSRGQPLVERLLVEVVGEAETARHRAVRPFLLAARLDERTDGCQRREPGFDLLVVALAPGRDCRGGELGAGHARALEQLPVAGVELEQPLLDQLAQALGGRSAEVGNVGGELPAVGRGCDIAAFGPGVEHLLEEEGVAGRPVVEEADELVRQTDAGESRRQVLAHGRARERTELDLAGEVACP